jgi:hypothetical protein
MTEGHERALDGERADNPHHLRFHCPDCKCRKSHEGPCHECIARNSERDNIADWLEGWSEGYDHCDTEKLQTALKAFAGDIRDNIHREAIA